MSKHKCGTCRYFQEARLASSGWCHHPQRKTTSDILIMVRKNELACRDEWSHDLWEARTDAGSLAAPIAEPYSHHKMPPASEQDIAAVMLAGQSTGASDPSTAPGADDVVLSELGVAADSPTYAPALESIRDWDTATGRPVEPGAPATPVVDTGTRNAIIRAREAFRERARQEAQRTAEHARFAELIVEEDPIASATDSPADDGIGIDSDAVVQQGVWLEDEPVPDSTDITVEASADVGLGTEPSLVDTELGPVDNALDEALADPAEDISAAAEGVDTEDLRSSEPAPTTLRDRWSRRLKPRQIERHRADDTSIPPAAEAHHGGGGEPSTVRTASGPAFDTAYLDWLDEEPAAADSPESVPAPNASSEGAVAASKVGHAFPDTNVAAYDNIDSHDTYDYDTETEFHAEGGELADRQGAIGDEVEIAEHVVAEDNIIAELPGLELSAHLPRTCRTCRDFRPAESGDRGWCANRWAFSHRRVVDADDLTPCESALGNWWLPVDEVWSDAADVSSHGQPTPLLDAWLPHHRGEEPAARRRS